MVRRALFLPMLISLAACGGGGGGSAPSPTPTSPPVVERSFDFAQGNGGWLTGQADHTPQTASTGCLGVGGAPGESVWVVFAVSTAEPLTVFNGTDYRVNVQRGNQGVGGTAGIVLGDIANGATDCASPNPPWRAKTLSSPEPATLSVRADERGEAWVLVGIDSGDESFSSVYLQRVALRFAPR